MSGIVENGVVTEVGEAGIQVRVTPSGSSCASCGHCATAGDGGMFMHDVADPFGVRVGDSVEVELPGGARLYASAISYALPVVGLILGYVAGFLLGRAAGWDPDATGALTAVASAAGTFMLGRRLAADVCGLERFRPRVRAIIGRSTIGPIDRSPGGRMNS
ncbi:MAG: SoxR reducing system RseC family protein [Coriobacteriia bacterium]|nr:SoxR reducing system RseC family protein [Coriobacteriia bacterium]